MLRHDAGAGVRRAKVLQLLAMQGLIVLVVIGFALASRDEPRTFGLSLWTLVVPVAFGLSYWSAYSQGEAARRGKTWTPEAQAAIGKRLAGRLGLTLMAWIAGMAGIYYFVS